MNRAVSRLLAVALVGLVAFGATGGALALGNGLAAVYGFSTPDGSFVIPYYQGVLGPNPVSPGTLVFGDTVYLEFVNSQGNRTVAVTTLQSAPGLSNISFNESFSVLAHNVTIFTLTLPPTTAQMNTRLCVDGGCVAFTHETPVTLFPSGVLDIGGLDLLVLAVTLESALAVFLGAPAARAITRKALWSPKFRAWLWAPHILGAFIVLIAFDFEAFDAVFGGWSFAIIPVVFGVLAFFWMLHLFNVAYPVEVLRPDPQAGHRLRFNRWRVFVGDLPDGTKVLVGTRWRDWLARLLGHHVVLVPANATGTKRGPPAESELRTFKVRSRADADKAWERVKRGFRVKPGRTSPLDDFQIAGEPGVKEKDAPRLLYWVDSDRWLSSDTWRLSFHREVRVDARYDRDGNLVREAHTRTKFSIVPHYVAPASAEAALAEFHYIDTPAAALGWIRAERAYRRVEDLRRTNYALRSTVFVTADDWSQEAMGELLTMLDRERVPLTDEEAEEDVRAGPPKIEERTSEGSVKVDVNLDSKRRPEDRAKGSRA
jgi:hypothetical protein